MCGRHLLIVIVTLCVLTLGSLRDAEPVLAQSLDTTPAPEPTPQPAPEPVVGTTPDPQPAPEPTPQPAGEEPVSEEPVGEEPAPGGEHEQQPEIGRAHV